jgi:hypothetical protein
MINLDRLEELSTDDLERLQREVAGSPDLPSEINLYLALGELIKKRKEREK